MEVDLGSKHARFVYSIRVFKPLKKKKKIIPKMQDLFSMNENLFLCFFWHVGWIWHDMMVVINTLEDQFIGRNGYLTHFHLIT